MRVVIADDESLVRAYLSSLLEEMEPNIEIVGKAINGLELISLVKAHQPDIAFVDIKMPKMNGLEAIRSVKDSFPQVQWVVLTGFSEFGYAKEAIGLGVSHYLLKPVKIDELRIVFNDLKKKSREAIHALNREFEYDLTAQFYEISDFSDGYEGSIPMKSQLTSVIFVFDSHIGEKAMSQYQKELSRLLREKISELADINCRIALILLPNGNLSLIGAWGIANEQAGKQTVMRIIEVTIQVVLQHINSYYVTVLKADWCKCVDDLYKCLNQLQNLSPLRVISNKSILSLNDLKKIYEEQPKEILELCNCLVDLAAAYRDKEYLSYMKILNEVERILANIQQLNHTQKDSAGRFIKYAIGCDINLTEKPLVVVKRLMERGEALLLTSQRMENLPTSMVNTVISFIEQNYTDKISLNQIADQLDITASYLSSHFHKKTGTTFVKYLTKYRMLKAKEQLINSNNSIREVAELVGYYSTRHFTKLFKEFFGVYPSEFRKNAAYSTTIKML